MCQEVWESVRKYEQDLYVACIGGKLKESFEPSADHHRHLMVWMFQLRVSL